MSHRGGWWPPWLTPKRAETCSAREILRCCSWVLVPPAWTAYPGNPKRAGTVITRNETTPAIKLGSLLEARRARGRRGRGRPTSRKTDLRFSHSRSFLDLRPQPGPELWSLSDEASKQLIGPSFATLFTTAVKQIRHKIANRDRTTARHRNLPKCELIVKVTEL